MLFYRRISSKSNSSAAWGAGAKSSDTAAPKTKVSAKDILVGKGNAPTGKPEPPPLRPVNFA